MQYINAFALIGGVSLVNFKKLLTYFSSLENAWTAPINEFIQAGLNRSLIDRISKQRSTIDPDQEMDKLVNEKIHLITIRDENYPKLLKEIHDPPAVIYVRGSLEPQDQFGLGVVGTRKLSDYGHQITPLITTDLTRAGFTIISGLAKGIDTLAHNAALKAKGRTIAVLGSGVNRTSIYPAENQHLAEEITQNGAVISEFPFGTKPLAQHFPMRNRIIAGMSLGVLVVEAPVRSGALITARNALEQNREVFAIPGHILSVNSAGPHKLIQMGAKLVHTASDIIEELNL